MDNQVSFWAGTFTSQEELDTYLDIDYSEEHDDDDYLASPFTCDFEIEYYDEDFREAHLRPEIEPLSYSETFSDQLPEIPEGTTSIIALYNFAYDGRITHKGKVTFLGTATYRR